MLSKTSIAVLLTFWFHCAKAQQPIGSWNILNAKINLDHHWSFFTEAQIRSLSFYNEFHYHELKIGANFSIDKNFSIAVGIGDYNTYSPGGNFKSPRVNDELRTWLQIGMSQYLERIKFDHRYRVEQRWTSGGYRNRFRYRLNAVLPINHKKLDKKTFYATAFDELFFTDKAPYFERNRFFVGAGYVFTSYFTLQAGILHQLDYKINEETNRSYFQLSLLYEVAFKKNRKENMPSSED